jgi:hypothetical protein
MALSKDALSPSEATWPAALSQSRPLAELSITSLEQELSGLPVFGTPRLCMLLIKRTSLMEYARFVRGTKDGRHTVNFDF